MQNQNYCIFKDVKHINISDNFTIEIKTSDKHCMNPKTKSKNYKRLKIKLSLSILIILFNPWNNFPFIYIKISFMCGLR